MTTTVDKSYNALNYEAQGGASHIIGGTLDIAVAAGGTFKMDGVAFNMARGEAAFDGSNPTPIVTGLNTVVAVIASLKSAVAPGDNTSVITANPNATPGTVDFYAWKNTGGTDPTLVASTGTESFYWIAIGT